jgi:diguanylate cyclase (GGDEF)-like protein
MKKSKASQCGELPPIAETIQWLRKSELFSSLEDDELEAVAADSSACRYSGGQSIFEEGSAGDALFILVEGRVSIGGDGSGAPVIAELVQGDSFGELELLASRPRNARASAAADSLLIRFPAEGSGFEAILQKNPALSARILEACLASVAKRIRHANSLLKDNSPWVQELRRQAYADKLTGLNNKAFLEERLAELVAANPGSLALLMLKPDNFKEINDTFGHEAGDATLVALAGELARSIGEGDAAARYLGNELAVILPGKGREAAADEAARLMDRMRAIDLGPLTGGGGMKLGVSFGVALYPEHGRVAEALIEAVRGLPLLGRERGGNLVVFPEDAALA